jgi:UDP-glucose 4-epimerase
MVGCHAARELTQRGDTVALFDVAPRLDYVARIAGHDAKVVHGDIGELPALIEAMADFRPDAVIHTAALIGTAAQRAPHRGFLVNVVGTVNVAEAVRLTGAHRLVHASSLAVNDRSWPQIKPITEDFPSSGNDNIYGASKVAAEHLLRAYSTHYKFELAMLRFAGVYGYGHFAGGSGVGRAIFNLVRDALEDRPGTIDAGIPVRREMI